MGMFEMVISNPQNGNFLRRIDWNRDAFNAQIKEIADRYSGELQISSTDDKKKAKEDRAFLIKVKNEIEARRKEIKAAIMEPYDIFEGEVKEGTAELDRVIKSIDAQIKAAEDQEKKAKINQIRQYWENHKDRPAARGALQTLTAWERIQKPDWLKASYTLKKAYADVDAAFEQALSDLKSIETIDDDRTMKNIMVDTLVETGSLQAALFKRARIHQQDKLRKEQEERERQAEQARREKEEAAARARREAEEAAHREKTQQSAAERLEALRERLGAQQQPEPAGRMEDAGETENTPEAAESDEKMSAPGDVRDRGPVGDTQNAGTVGDDAQDHAGQDQGRAQEEKIYKASFWVAGTKDQLKALGDYIKDIGFAGYGSIKA